MINVYLVQLKGFPKEQISDEVDRIISILNLEDKRDSRSKTLSGGMKRKLSIGIALIGDSKVRNFANTFPSHSFTLCASQSGNNSSAHASRWSCWTSPRPVWIHRHDGPPGTFSRERNEVAPSCSPLTSWTRPTYSATGSPSWQEVSCSAAAHPSS